MRDFPYGHVVRDMGLLDGYSGKDVCLMMLHDARAFLQLPASEYDGKREGSSGESEVSRCHKCWYAHFISLDPVRSSKSRHFHLIDLDIHT